MRTLKFPADFYVPGSSTTDFVYKKTDESMIGKLELLWQVVQNSPLTDLTKRDHRINRRLKQKIRAITMHKDKDQDSRITHPGPQTLILEEDEYALLMRHFDSQKFVSKASEDVDDLDLIITSAEYESTPEPSKPKLLDADAS